MTEWEEQQKSKVHLALMEDCQLTLTLECARRISLGPTPFQMTKLTISQNLRTFRCSFKSIRAKQILSLSMILSNLEQSMLTISILVKSRDLQSLSITSHKNR